MAGCRLEPRNKSKPIWLGFACAVLSLGADGSKVTAVRFWSVGDVTRVAVEVSSEFRYKFDRLTNPDRLFFDIIGARPAEMLTKGMHVIAVDDGLVKQIRIAETQRGVTRVVIDLEQNASFTASQLSSPDRLMIQLRVKDHAGAPPPTASVSGAKTIAAAPVEPVQEDLIATPVAEVKDVAPQTKPEPKKFEPPPDRLPAYVSGRPELLAQPPSSLAYRTSRVASPAPAVNILSARVTPPADVIAPLAVPIAVAPKPATLVAAKPEPVTEPLPAKKNANGDRSLTRVLGLKLGRVVLDPGHGGHDAGTHGPSGLAEKDVVLDVAQRLGALLESRLNSEVIYTRNDDTFIPLEQRTQIANDKKADLFLSIHANSSPYRTVSGVETYYLNFTTSKTALDVAARENASSERSVFDLKELLEKIALKDKIDESREFAARVETSLYGISSRSNPEAKNRGVKKAPFVVLIGAEMPSVLAEIGFLTNASDEALLRKPEHRQKIAEALYKGIASYADTLSHFQVARRE
jgi:N-acetylmuramoyl-L-alanine amidase